MRPANVCLWLGLIVGPAVRCPAADAPRNVGVTFDGEADPLEPLAADQWLTVAARYRYPGGIDLLTNMFLVFARGGNLLAGWDMGYNLPADQLMIVKHGFWNATEATGHPGEAGRVIENDQGFIDCEHTRVERTADEIAVIYRLKFKPGVLRGMHNVFMYVEDKDVKYEGFTQQSAVAIGLDAETYRTDMPPAWRNALRPAGKPSAPLRLADGGQARYSVVIPRNAQRSEAKAAADLCRHLKLISGADFRIVSEDALPAAANRPPCISVGRTDLLARSKARWKGADLAEEGYAVEVVGPNLFLYGGRGRGLIHGVYALLEEDLGCRWYATDSLDTPRMPRLSARFVSRKFVPALELRDPYIYAVHDANWSLRNKTNTPHARVPLAWGGSLRYHNMGHTYAGYFPTAQYFAEHPEYYALVNGKRQPSQLCCTNEDVIRLSIEKTCAIFRDHPEVTITAIGPNDGRGFCDCPDCKRLDDENGGRSGSYFHLINRIAEGVKQSCPERHIIALTYLDYAAPPTHLKVDASVIVQLCTDSHAWKYQFCFLWESPEFQRILKAWQAAKARVFVWDYTTDYVHYLVPMANWAVVAGNTRYLIQHGVTGMMYESEANDIDELRGWVWAKQMWNPALDTKSLLHDFIFGYYKEAAQPIWDYETTVWDWWERWHRLPHRCGEPSDNPLLNNLQCSYAPDGPMFTPEFMAAMRRSFAAAEGLAQSDTIRERVKRAELSLWYVELSQELGYYTEFGDFVEGRSLRRPRSDRETLRPKLDEFVAVCGRRGLATLGIAGSVDKIVAKWRSCIDSESAALPKMYLPAEWVFAPDAADRGVTERWFADRKYFDAADRREAGTSRGGLGPGLHVLHINRGVGWEQQGFPGFAGFGWYFQDVEIPAEVLNHPHVYLYFLGVNEQAWVYVNGEPALERSYAATGKGVGELAGVPFSADVKRWLTAQGKQRIAIRVTHAAGLGGIGFPAMVVGTDEECSAEQLARYRY